MQGDDYVGYLEEEANSANAAFQEFVVTYDDNDNEIHVFLEGDDDFTYYLPIIKSKAGNQKIIPYNCGGKWNVVEARDAIEAYYSVNCLFFVDRDYDDLLGRQALPSDRLYITNGYSIENDVVTEHSALAVFQDILALPRLEVDNLMKEVENSKSILWNRIVSLSAWIITAKYMGYKTNLNNADNLSKIITVDNNGKLVLTNSGFTNFKKRVNSGNPEPTYSDVLPWRRRINGMQLHAIVRGKYFGWIFCKSVWQTIIIENKKRSNAGQAAIRIPEAISSFRVVELLASRVPYPRSLEDFLNRHIRYI